MRSDEDEIPLSTLFRSYRDMPKIEQMAIDMAKGKTFDVGAGSGCHSLALQNRVIDVIAVDISILSVETMKQRGARNILCQDFFTLSGQQYDIILMPEQSHGIYS